jgi:uncharacterized RDD family membrane protein YckC
MDDAREWSGTAPGARAGAPAAVQPGDPWGAPAWASDRRGEAAARAVPGRPAGVWRRAVALAVDVAVVLLVMRVGAGLAAGLAALAPGLHLPAQALALTWFHFTPVAYFVLGHGTAGQTVGKRLLGIRVVDRDGRPIGYYRALGRLLATVAAALPLALGLALAGLRADRRGLHDLLAGTRVVRVG